MWQANCIGNSHGTFATSQKVRECIDGCYGHSSSANIDKLRVRIPPAGREGHLWNLRALLMWIVISYYRSSEAIFISKFLIRVNTLLRNKSILIWCCKFWPFRVYYFRVFLSQLKKFVLVHQLGVYYQLVTKTPKNSAAPSSQSKATPNSLVVLKTAQYLPGPEPIHIFYLMLR